MGQTQGCNLLTFSPAFRNQQLGFSVGAFAQDRWQITQFLRVNPGIRVDYGRTTNSRGEEVSSLIGFGPRLGLLFDLTQDGKTLFTAYYGRSNEVLSLLAAAYADITPSSLTQSGMPMQRRFVTSVHRVAMAVTNSIRPERLRTPMK